MQFIYDLTFYMSLVIVIIPIVMLCYRFSHHPQEIKGLVFILIFSFSCDLLAEVLDQLNRHWINLASTLYVIFSPMLFSYLFYYCLRWPKWKRPLVFVNVGLMLFFLYNSFFLQKIAINSYSAVLGHLLILFLSISYYNKLLKELPAARIQDLPLFWIISAFFLTHSGKLVLLMVTNYMVTVLNDNLMALWILHNGLSIIGLFILMRGAWLANNLQRTKGAA